MSLDREYVIVPFALFLALAKGDLQRDAEDPHDRLFEVFCKDECNTMIIALRWHKHPSSSANRLSDFAVTVNINAQFNLSLI